MKQISTIAAVMLSGFFGPMALPAFANERVIGDWIAQRLNGTPLAFTKNVGQWDEQVLFRADAGTATVWVTAEGAHYQFARRISSDNDLPQSAGHPDGTPERLETIAVKAVFVGANANPVVSGVDLLDYKCNYFIGNDAAKWRTDVPNYKAILLEEIYPGIDLVYYGNDHRMEYDFRVAAGADHSQIRIRYEGTEGLTIAADGALVIATAWGEIRELAPVVYQEIRGRRRPVTARYELQGNNAFGFRLGPEYDVSLPVVIDPILVYSVFVGGTKNDASRAIAVDASGAAYITGETFSGDFPTRNAYQTTEKGYFNAFVTKVSGAGNALLFSTYFGGSVSDAGNAIAVDASGAVYVTGFAASSNFPTRNAYQPDFSGGTADAFVVKLSRGGNLIYSTFLGGAVWDNGHSIAVDASGAAYVTGYTSSTDFPTRLAYQESNAGNFDVFVAKLSSQGSSLVYCTYLGGSGADDANGVAVDDFGKAYLTGRTLSVDFPTVNPYQTDRPGSDVFVTELSAAGNSLVFSSYLGGGSDDYGHGIAVTASGDVYVSGRTKSADFPTMNAYQNANHGAYDAFVTRFSNAGGLIYSTYLGGAADDFCYALDVDLSGRAHVTGRAFSSDFPTTLDAYQETFQGGSSDAFLSRLSTAGDDLIYSSYLGGAAYDGAYGVAADTSGAVYVTGFTDSGDFPTLTNCQESLPVGAADVFVTKFVEQLGPDRDGDGVADAADNCPDISNPCQEDNNGDGVGNACCCVDRVGDANGEGDYPDEVTLGDIMLLVDAKFISGDCSRIACIFEADVNQDGGSNPDCDNHVTLGDIMYLVDFLFITGPQAATLSDCQ